MKFVSNVLFLSTLTVIGATLDSIPTIYEKKQFNKAGDCEDLYNSFHIRRSKTFEDKISAVLCNRNFEQRQQIINELYTQYNESLEQAILQKTDDDFQSLLLALVEDQYLRDVKILNHEMPFEPVFDILATRSPEELKHISKLFKQQNNGYSIDDLIEEKAGLLTRPFLRKFLYRNETKKVVDQKTIEKCAKRLHDLTKVNRNDFREEMNIIEVYTEMFTTLSWQQLSEVSKKYEEKYRHSLKDAIGVLMSGLERYGFGLINDLARNKNVHYAKILNEAVKGHSNKYGSRENELIHLIVSRSEIDLESIKIEYAKLFGVTLIESINLVTSGPFRDGLIAIVNGNKGQ